MSQNTPTAADMAELLEIGHVLADRSAEAILPHFRRPISVDNKASDGGFDPVTEADRAAEVAIRRELERLAPDHGIVGEEFASKPANGRYRWVVDPIDGTRAFIMGYPVWGTLIGLLHDETPLLGIMDQPFTRERFWSEGGVAYGRWAGCERQRLATRPCPSLDAAVFSTTHPDLFAAGREAEAFAALKARTRMTRYGGDCYAYCLLAAGYVDIIFETGLKPHDIVALIPIVEGAGGAISTWTGEPATQGGAILATGDKRLHEAALGVLGGVLSRG
ncbi:MAG: histidinol-phosphatase [Hyphomicrobiaceae bacterium]|nr:histidinol-phosphatase [Hyphomicrobiaceae bacterium]